MTHPERDQIPAARPPTDVAHHKRGGRPPRASQSPSSAASPPGEGPPPSISRGSLARRTSTDNVVFLEPTPPPPGDPHPELALASAALALVSALAPPLSRASLLALRAVTALTHREILSSLLRLIRADLVEIADQPTGRSALAVRLTPAGRALAREISETAATGRPRMLARGAS